MTFTRLGTIAPELVAMISAASPEQLAGAAAASVTAAFAEAPVADPRIDVARAALAAGRFGDTALRDQVMALVEELDEAAWDLQDADDAAYSPAFSKARAVNTLWYALAGPDRDSTMECVYEAFHVFDDTTELHAIVAAALG